MSETLIRTEVETEAESDEQDELCTAELADCTCPEFCERDHDNE